MDINLYYTPLAVGRAVRETWDKVWIRISVEFMVFGYKSQNFFLILTI